MRRLAPRAQPSRQSERRGVPEPHDAYTRLRRRVPSGAPRNQRTRIDACAPGGGERGDRPSPLHPDAAAAALQDADAVESAGIPRTPCSASSAAYNGEMSIRDDQRGSRTDRRPTASCSHPGSRRAAPGHRGGAPVPARPSRRTRRRPARVRSGGFGPGAARPPGTPARRAAPAPGRRRPRAGHGRGQVASAARRPSRCRPCCAHLDMVDAVQAFARYRDPSAPPVRADVNPITTGGVGIGRSTSACHLSKSFTWRLRRRGQASRRRCRAPSR